MECLLKTVNRKVSGIVIGRRSEKMMWWWKVECQWNNGKVSEEYNGRRSENKDWKWKSSVAKEYSLDSSGRLLQGGGGVRISFMRTGHVRKNSSWGGE